MGFFRSKIKFWADFNAIWRKKFWIKIQKSPNPDSGVEMHLNHLFSNSNRTELSNVKLEWNQTSRAKLRTEQHFFFYKQLNLLNKNPFPGVKLCQLTHVNMRKPLPKTEARLYCNVPHNSQVTTHKLPQALLNNWQKAKRNVPCQEKERSIWPLRHPAWFCYGGWSTSSRPWSSWWWQVWQCWTSHIGTPTIRSSSVSYDIETGKKLYYCIR